jgi:hypothetical protein
MKFKEVKEYDNSTLDQRIEQHNRWKRWESRGGPLGPGVESILSKAEVAEAVAYGDPLIRTDDDKPNIDGQVEILTNAKKLYKPAVNYLWLQMQDVILDKFWHNRVGQSDKRRRRMGHNSEVWTEWLTACYATLQNPMGHNDGLIELGVPGVSALEGFDLAKSAPFAAFSNFAKTRYGLMLKNTANTINYFEYMKGMTKVPFMSNDNEVNAAKAKKRIEPKVLEYDPKYMDAAQQKEDGISDPTADAAFEAVFQNSEETDQFFEEFKDVLNDAKGIKTKGSGIEMLEAFLYLIDDEMGVEKDGKKTVAEKWGDVLDNFPQEDRKEIQNMLRYKFPDILAENGMDMKTFLKYATDSVTGKRMAKLIRDRISK